MKRSWGSTLAQLQIASLFAWLATAITIIRIYHHQTSDTFVPFWKYISSIRIAIPPILLLFCSYALLFLGGVSISDAPKAVISFFRNRYFQQQGTMLATCIICLLFVVVTNAELSRRTPPEYSRLVDQLLGSESDDGKIVQQRIQALKTSNPDFADQLGLIHQTFEERRKWNFNHKSMETATPRILARALETNVKPSWLEHPLRFHALGEVYSMWAQATKASPIRENTDTEWLRLRDRSLEYYGKVIASKSPLATELLKISALQNSGTLFLYSGDTNKAIEVYKTAFLQNKNLSTGGNLIAALLISTPPRVEEAKALGADLKEWALNNGKAVTETSPYSSVLVNLGFAYLMNGEFKEGRINLREAYELIPDSLNSLNLAAAFKLEKREDDAMIVLDSLKMPPLTPANHFESTPKHPSQPYCLIRALVSNIRGAQEQALYYLGYLGRPSSEVDIRSITETDLVTLRKESLARLKMSSGPEQSLLYIPAFRALLEESGEAASSREPLSTQ